jgi:C4-dicarboxylate transporter DctM subunit
MSPAEIGFIGFVVLIVLIMLGVNLAFALVMVGFVGLVAVMGLQPALSNLALIAFERADNYDMAVLPLFLLMGAFVAGGNIAKESYEMARAWMGEFKGGLAIATTAACALFAACSGSSLAGAVVMGKISYPEMKRYGYDDGLSVGTIAAGGTMGILIPPSLGFILVGILAQMSIGKLFIAGILPGICQAVFYMITIYILCKINPNMGPALPKTTKKEKMLSLKLTWPVLLLFLLVVGGLYGGVFTATEAGGIGAFGALVISLARKQLNRSSFVEALLDTAKTTGFIFAILIGAYVLNNFISVTRIPNTVGEFIIGLGLNKYLVLFCVLILYIMLGMLFDIYAMMVLTIPILFPLMMSLGFDPIWYGVIMVRLLEIGDISPPFAMNIFALKGVTGLPLTTIYRGVIPFLIADALNLALLCAVPAISTFLPNLMIRPG